MRGHMSHPRYGGIEWGTDDSGHEIPTPGPSRASGAHQKLVVQLVAGLLHHEVNPEKLAADLMTQPVAVQREVAKFLFAMVGLWAEMGEFTQPTHPLAHEYATAHKMVQNLFTSA